MLFNDLAETLLRGGIAPRYVRRYLAELREHLDDLTAQQREAGHNSEDAAIRARARLGSDDELAAAMLEQKQFRSLAARAPWAVFMVFPPLAAIAIGIPFVCGLVLIGQYYDFLDMQAPLPPQWFLDLASDLILAANLTMMPLAAILFVAIAQRQRLKLVWPCIAIALLLILFIHVEMNWLPRDNGNLSIEAAPIFMASGWKMMAEHWPLVMAQDLLTLIPLFWLAYRRRAQA